MLNKCMMLALGCTMLSNRHRRCGTICTSIDVAMLHYQLTEWMCKHPYVSIALEAIAVLVFGTLYWGVLLLLAIEYAL
jgi:hypothetical protein